eukprot:7771435-Lingulodinium_polyedra.AAC.1
MKSDNGCTISLPDQGPGTVFSATESRPERDFSNLWPIGPDPTRLELPPQRSVASVSAGLRLHAQ